MSKRNPVASLEKPSVDQATEFIKNAVSEHKAVIIVGNCWVNYKGRASSKLEPGERMVIIKEDGSVLVHRPNGYVPVNWQPAGCTFQVRTKDETVRIRATRRKPLESLSVFFDVVFVVSAMKPSPQRLYAHSIHPMLAVLRSPGDRLHGTTRRERCKPSKESAVS